MKYVFFTGATGGLGSLCVKALSDTGRWTVFAAGTNAGSLSELGKLPNVIPVRCDVTAADSVEAARQFVIKTAAKLDAVVNFVGVASFTSMVEGSCVEEMQKVLDVNVTGMARVNRVFFEMILAGRGRIINCSSEAGWMTPQPFDAPYAASKYAVEAYNDSLRRELMYLHIPVIKIQPGSYQTPMTQHIRDGFDSTVSHTKYYKKMLNKMKPLMDHELAHGKDPRRLVNAVLRAMESAHPRIRYRAGTGTLLRLLDLLPDCLIDRVYRFFYR